MENMLAGKKDAKAALDSAVARGNEMLRRFEKTVEGVSPLRALTPFLSPLRAVRGFGDKKKKKKKKKKK